VVETIDVAGDAMIKAVTKLKPGDKADITYQPVVALSLDRADSLLRSSADTGPSCRCLAPI
jgi:hypothetical protein